MNNLSAFKFRSGNQDRVTDNVAAYYERVRTNSPRQRRLAAQRKALIASYHCIISDIVGGIVISILIAILIVLFFFI